MTTSPLLRLPQPRKPSLRFLMLTHQIQPEALARQSGLPLLTAVAIVIGYGTTEEVAQKALDGLNTLKGTHYTLADIEIDLHRSQTEMSETPGEYPVVPIQARAALFTRYVVIADGRILYEGEEWGRAYRIFCDHVHNNLIRDLQCLVKRRALPASGLYPDIVW